MWRGVGDKMEPNPESSHCACIRIVFIFLNGERILDDQEVIVDRNEVMGGRKEGKRQIIFSFDKLNNNKGGVHHHVCWTSI